MNIRGYNINALIYIYSVTISIIAFIIMGVDKNRAIRKGWRIKESVLLLISFIGGSKGTIMAMIVFKHKIRNKKFFIGVPIIYLLQMMIYIILLIY